MFRSPLLSLPLFLALALGREVGPGEAFTLAFPRSEGEVFGETWDTGPFWPLLLSAGGEGPALAVLEVPPNLAPGVYPVCLAHPGGKWCQEVRVRPFRRLEVEVPRRALGEVRLLFRNRGNLPERVWIGPAPESPLAFAGKELHLVPGEERTLFLTFPEGGEAILLLSHEGVEEERYPVRVETERGAPPLYRLRGRVEGAYPGPWGRLALDGPLSQETNLSLKLEGGEKILAHARLELSAWGLEGGSTGVGVEYRGSTFRLRGGYPWFFEGEWWEGEGRIRLGISPEGIRGGYTRPGFSVQGSWAGGPSFRLERIGETHLYLVYEGGLRLGGGLPGLSGELLLLPEVGLRLQTYGSLGRGGYRLEGNLSSTGTSLGGSLYWPIGPLGLTGSLSLGTGSSLSLSLAYREGRTSLSLGGSLSAEGTSFWGRGNWEEGPWSLEASLALGGGTGRFSLKGGYAFALAVPRDITEALGGYYLVPVEGRVEILGRPVEGALVRGEGVTVKTDGEGGFRLYLPRDGARVQAIPPPGLPAFPSEQIWKGERSPLRLELPPGSLIRLRCTEGGRGAYLLGLQSTFLPCGGQAVLPPGTYRFQPNPVPGYRVEETAGEVVLQPLMEHEIALSFQPTPQQRTEEILGPEVLLPAPAAPGELVLLGLQGWTGKVRLTLKERERLFLVEEREMEKTLSWPFQIPWDAQGPIVGEVAGEGWQKAFLLGIDPGKEVLTARLEPPRGTLGQEILVIAETRFPAEVVFLFLPDGSRLDLSLAETTPTNRRFTSKFVLRPEHLQGEETHGRLALRLQVVAWQGNKKVEKPLRLLVNPP